MTERRRGQSIWHDEHGKPSMARVLLVWTLVFTAVVIAADAFVSGVDVPTAAYSLLGIVIGGELGWVGVPRAAANLGGIAAGIAQARAQVPIESSVSFQAHEWASGEPHEGIL